jgi:hypothetical protein
MFIYPFALREPASLNFPFAWRDYFRQKSTGRILRSGCELL